MSARERILTRVRDALEDRTRTPHPGVFTAPRPSGPANSLDDFTAMFTRAGGEVIRVADEQAATSWLRDFADDFTSVSIGATVPPAMHPPLPAKEPETAALGLSMARGAVAETGSLMLDARDGRRTQLLPPVHVVVVPAGSIHTTLVKALQSLRPTPPSALGLHSGPSKSADIGQILVKGVHGPGRVVALFLEA